MTDYTIIKDPASGLLIVRFRGSKIGTAQTIGAARLIRSYHRRGRAAR